jgi:heptaprenyl diphosphate synthase
MILSYVEVLLPPIFSAVPGIKIGLANIVVLFILYRYHPIDAALVSAVRIFAVTLLFGNPVMLAYSAAGAVLSITIMAILKKLNILSTLGVSVAGAVFHNVGQILMAMALLGTAELGYYLIVLTVTGTISGIFVGICGGIAIRRLPDFKS